MKKIFNLKEYTAMLALVANKAYESSESYMDKFDLSGNDDLLRGLDFARLFLVADLASCWFDIDRNSLEIDLFNRFYKTYPDDFLSDLRDCIKTQDTQLVDICDFLAYHFSEEGAIERYAALLFITSTLTFDLSYFSAIFRSTTQKDGLFIVNYRKAKRLQRKIKLR